MAEGHGLDPGELQRRASRGVTWSAFSTVVSLPLAIVVSVVLARSLGPHEFARFAYLSFVVPLLLNLTDLGVSQATTRAASQSFAQADLGGTRDVLSKLLGWNLLRLPFVGAVVLVVVRPEREIAVVLLAGLVLTFAASGLLFSLQAENRGAINAKLAFVQGLASGFCAMGAAVGGASGTTVWVVTFVSATIVVPGWLIFANPSLRRAALTPKLPRRLPDRFWRYGMTSVVLALLSALVFSRSEVVILEALGDQQALAVFALAFGLAQRLTTPVDTLLGPLIPALSALASAHPERLRPGFSRALRLSCTAVAFLAGAAVVGTMLAAPILFGPEYDGTGPAFAVLAGVSLLRAAAQPYIAVAHALGRVGALVRANAIALTVDVAVALALIPSLGVWGAVIANVTGGLLALFLSIRATPAAGGVRAAGVPVGRLLAVTATSMTAAYAVGLLGGALHPAAGALVAIAAGGACFVALAKLSGGLLPDRDAAVLLDVLPGPLARLSRPFIPIMRVCSADAQTSLTHFFRKDSPLAHDPSGRSDGDGSVGNRPRDHAAGADDRIAADRHPIKNDDVDP